MARTSTIMALIALLFALALAAPTVRSDSTDESAADAAILSQEKIQPTRDGVTAFLRQLKTDLVDAKLAENLIPQLGAAKFSDREAAERRLIGARCLPVNPLRQAAVGADPEIAARAKRILGLAEVAAKVARADRQPRIGAAVCRTIRDKAISGAAPVLLEIIPHLDGPESVDLTAEAMAVTAGADDTPSLRQGLASKNLNLRIAAVRGLGKADPKADADLRALIADVEPRLALAAAHSLAERGDRSVLAILVRLNSNADEQVRARSEQILRAWTGKDLGFNPFQDPATQKERLARWTTWVSTEGRTARLIQPIRLAPLPEDLRRGLILYYTFEPEQAGRLTDRSGHGRDGTLHNDHAQVEGVTGKAIEVRGTGDTGARGGHALLPFIDFTALDQFTVALWVNERGMSDMHGEAYVVFGADRKVGVEDSLGISHFNESVFFRVGGAMFSVPYDKADRNRWVHYALTFQAGRVQGYKDGRLMGEAKGGVVVVGKQAALGRHWWDHGAVTSSRFIGAFDELRIYQRALSAAQIEMLRAASKQ